MFDYTFYYKTSITVHELYQANLFSYCEYQPVITINTPPVVVAPLEAENWLEMYEWQGSPPQSCFWKWIITANHYCIAYAVSGVLYPATAKGEVRIDGRAKAVESEVRLKKKSGAQVNEDEDGVVYVGLDWSAGLVFDLYDQNHAQTIGTTGVRQAIDSTTGIGPYDLYSIIDSAYAITEVTNEAGYEKAYARASMDVIFSEN